MASVSIDASNGGISGPSHARRTVVKVTGDGFAGTKAVVIQIVSSGGELATTTAAVKSDGSFEHTSVISPALDCDALVDAIVQYGQGEKAIASDNVICPPPPGEGLPGKRF
jgi:hypothetical protein